MKIETRQMMDGDWPSVEAIYREGIETGLATFQTEVPTWEQWDTGHLNACRWVAIDSDQEGAVVGFAVLSPVSARAAYRGVAEVSVYVSKAARNNGVGRRLIEQLISSSEAAGIWTLQSGIISKNEASLRLHQNCGFRTIGFRERVSQLKTGIWADVTLVERRSSVVGKD